MTTFETDGQPVVLHLSNSISAGLEKLKIKTTTTNAQELQARLNKLHPAWRKTGLEFNKNGQIKQ